MMKNKLGFDFSHFRGDFFGGITAGIVALPLALAFGLQSGLGADAGLYGAIFISFFAALFGGTNTQISGPTAPMTAVSMVIIAGMIAPSSYGIKYKKSFDTIFKELSNQYNLQLIPFLLEGVAQKAEYNLSWNLPNCLRIT